MKLTGCRETLTTNFTYWLSVSVLCDIAITSSHHDVIRTCINCVVQSQRCVSRQSWRRTLLFVSNGHVHLRGVDVRSIQSYTLSSCHCTSHLMFSSLINVWCVIFNVETVVNSLMFRKFAIFIEILNLIWNDLEPEMNANQLRQQQKHYLLINVLLRHTDMHDALFVILFRLSNNGRLSQVHCLSYRIYFCMLCK